MLLLNISVIWSISFDDVQYWAGEGSDQALVLIDGLDEVADQIRHRVYEEIDFLSEQEN